MSSPRPAIEVEALPKSYGPLKAVDGASFPAGAGRTTIECLEGMRPPDAADIRILGAAVSAGAFRWE